MNDRNDLSGPANLIAGSIDQVERAIDASLAQFGQFLHDLAAGRLAWNLSACYGHEVFEATLPTLSSIVASRASIVDIHRRLSAVQRHQKIVLAIPPTDKPPTFASVRSAPPLEASAA